MKCRFCNNILKHTFANLGYTPFANSYLEEENIECPNTYYPLKAYVCSKCYLVQSEKFQPSEKIFSKYAYYSSFSDSWINHVKEFSKMMVNRFNITENQRVVEIASNDGYMLQFFKKQEIPVMGVEPASNISKIAQKKGILTINKFFGYKTARELVQNNKKGDIVIAFNVLPHVPDLNDFVRGLKTILNKNGVLVIQFSAYLLDLISKTEFDVIYHEHFSYFSLYTLQKIFLKHNLEIFDVEQIPVHGGSMRIYIKHKNNNLFKVKNSVRKQIEKEIKFGISKIRTFTNLKRKIILKKQQIWKIMNKITVEQKNIVAYGAPAKATTLLNYCGINSDLISYTVDRSKYKQKLFLPGTNIKILDPKMISKTKPDYVLILAWNLKDEIAQQLNFIKSWGGKFIVLIPEVKIF